jgi:apolipoprotein N-acyltransferase
MTQPATKADRGWRRVFAAGLLGALHAAAFSPPLGGWWLQLLSMAALVAIAPPLRASGESGRAALTWAAFGLANFTVGLSWLHTSMHVYGGMPSLLAALAVLLFAAYLTLFPLLALGTAAAALRVAGAGAAGPTATALAVGGAWGLAELLRGWALTGFPWLSIGYAHVDGPLAGLAPWVGIYGMSAMAAGLAALLGCSARTLIAARTGRNAASEARGAWRALGVGALLLAGAALPGRLELARPTGTPLQVRLVQGNVPQQMKFNRDRTLQAMEDYAGAVESSKAQLTVLPETAWTLPWNYTPEAVAQRINTHARRNGAAVAIGMPLPATDSGAGRGRYTNSVLLLDGAEGGAAGRYDKRHLVPFGEFVPTGFRWFVDLMRIPLGEFSRGGPLQPPIAVGGQRLAFNICYEDLFGAELLPVIRMSEGATVLVNVSNIAWFGDSHALPQHLAIGRMRALETGRPMLRATNTGVTAVIDHRGRVMDALPGHTTGVLDATVQGTTGLTPYAALGDPAAGVPCALALAAVTLAGLRRRCRKR